jgi:hypothetical protein
MMESTDDDMALDPDEDEDEDLQEHGPRRSSRKTKHPSRFANAVKLGMKVGKLFDSDTSWNNIIPLKPLPERNKYSWSKIQASYPHKRSETCLSSVIWIDSMKNGILTLRSQILRHRKVKYHRKPGKDNYGPFAEHVTTCRIRLHVKFFSGTKQWIPLESARNDPFPVVEYSINHKLTKLRDWKWVQH